jgi:Xanthine dehydrogenase, iron-sulfur cluster and FAD-binding subunit A
MGTVGGNLASGEPLTDLSQIFIALDGKARIVGPNGGRTIAVEELFLTFIRQASLKMKSSRSGFAAVSAAVRYRVHSLFQQLRGRQAIGWRCGPAHVGRSKRFD